MSKPHYRAFSGAILGIGLVLLAWLMARAAGGQATDRTWSTTTFDDFRQGILDGVDIWSEPGSARLDRAWWPIVQVNDRSARGKFAPSLSFVLRVITGTSRLTETQFLSVWEDERFDIEQGVPDIYFARSTDGGRTWSSDVLVSGAHSSGQARKTPDITARAADGSLWVVWQDNRLDDGDIFHAVSADNGATWSSASAVYMGSGTQRLPGIAPHGASGYLYAVWEDEQTGDDGDIYVSRFNPDVDAAWGVPNQVNDDTSPPVEQRDPNLAVDAEGNLFVVWEDLRGGGGGEVYFSQWISGTAWSTWITPTQLSTPGVERAFSPDITAGSGGLVVAAWVEQVTTGAPDYNHQIVAGRSQDYGTTWERVVVRRLLQASAAGAAYTHPVVRADATGRVHVAWQYILDEAEMAASILFSRSPDRGEHWTNPLLLSQWSNKETVPALAVDMEGRTVIAWQDDRHPAGPQIYASGYPADRYLTGGVYRSPVFDAGAPAVWGTMTWTAEITSGSSLVLATRVLTQPDAEWTEWVTQTAPGNPLIHPNARFIEYRALLTSDGGSTPVLDEVRISYQQYDVYVPLVLRGN